jgi:hypothetical protein
MRPRVVLSIALLLGVSAPAAAALLPDQDQDPLAYRIDLRLDEDGRTIQADLEVRWTNTGAEPTSELRWHVYNNAWAGPESVYFHEARRFGDASEPITSGGTQVEDVRLRLDGEELPLDWEYLPQAGAPEDRTVARTMLPVPVEPGGTVDVALRFTATMPQAFRRSGWGPHGYLHAVQWYPKLGVFEELDGAWQWNCEPYRYLVEFYADYGSYEVRLTLPERYKGKLLSTGSHRGEPQDNADGTVTYDTFADRVHDYAWTVDDDALIEVREFRAENWRDEAEEEKVARALGLTVEEVRPTPTTMILMLQPEHAGLADRYFEALGKSLYYFGLWYGSYPYPTLSCVDPANDARRTGGMEYPRLITGGTHLGNLDTTHSPEGVTVHEVGHQFWYGLVGNDEFRHAWLDEGFTTYATERALVAGWPRSLETWSVFGREVAGRLPLERPSYEAGDWRALLDLSRWESPDLRWVPAMSYELRHRNDLERLVAELPPVTAFPRVERNRTIDLRRAMDRDWSEPLSTPTMELFDTLMRRTNAYRRPAMTLETMGRLMGEERWIRVLHRYHQAWRYKHPRPQDFLDVVLAEGQGAAVTGDDGVAVPIDWTAFWRHAYEGNDRLGFKAHHLRNIPAAAAEDGSARWTVHAGIHRTSDFAVPVPIRLTWEDGSTTTMVWDAADWTWDHTIAASPLKALRLDIDPERLLILEDDWIDNSISLTPDQGIAWDLGVQAMLWAQQVLHFYGGAG